VSAARHLRVVQWTTGKTGSAAVRGMVGHPVIELVGCYAYSPEKVGKDVGELCGIEPIGLTATDDIDALLALEPDCVVYTAYRPNFDHIVRILESGTNIVASMYMLSGRGYGEEPTARIRDAALRGGSSLYTSGIYPGHAPMVALAVSAMCSRIERISVLESLDITGYANEQMFRAQGFDLEPDDPEAAERCEASCGSFKDQIPVMARALGVKLDGVGFKAEFAVANEDTDFGFMTVGKGRIAGFRGTISGLVDGRSVIECRFVWKLGEDMTPNWPVTHGYVIEIEGEPGVRCKLEPLDEHFDGAVTTSMPIVNAIPAVCAAPPGIVNQMELPLVRGAHTIR
jgi:2,4-diaminopentanoate dehydrogenase